MSALSNIGDAAAATAASGPGGKTNSNGWSFEQLLVSAAKAGSAEAVAGRREALRPIGATMAHS
jgi:hypothetical protein